MGSTQWGLTYAEITTLLTFCNGACSLTNSPEGGCPCAVSFGTAGGAVQTVCPCTLDPTFANDRLVALTVVDGPGNCQEDLATCNNVPNSSGGVCSLAVIAFNGAACAAKGLTSNSTVDGCAQDAGIGGLAGGAAGLKGGFWNTVVSAGAGAAGTFLVCLHDNGILP